ncbi:MAG: hypothetical protein NVSMB7_13730 [Chitinophagaceae bacterium]
MKCFGQLRKVPAEVTEAFKAKYPDTKNAEWKDKLTGFQVNYEMGGIKISVNKDGRLLKDFITI